MRHYMTKNLCIGKCRLTVMRRRWPAACAPMQKYRGPPNMTAAWEIIGRDTVLINASRWHTGVRLRGHELRGGDIFDEIDKRHIFFDASAVRRMPAVCGQENQPCQILKWDRRRPANAIRRRRIKYRSDTSLMSAGNACQAMPYVVFHQR